MALICKPIANRFGSSIFSNVAERMGTTLQLAVVKISRSPALLAAINNFQAAERKITFQADSTSGAITMEAAIERPLRLAPK